MYRSKRNRKTLAPRIVINSTLGPKRYKKTETAIACTIIDLIESIIASIGCVLKTVNGVNVSAEWWILWKAQSIGKLWKALWTKYFVKSSSRNKINVKRVEIWIADAFGIKVVRPSNQIWKNSNNKVARANFESKTGDAKIKKNLLINIIL